MTPDAAWGNGQGHAGREDVSRQLLLHLLLLFVCCFLFVLVVAAAAAAAMSWRVALLTERLPGSSSKSVVLAKHCRIWKAVMTDDHLRYTSGNRRCLSTSFTSCTTSRSSLLPHAVAEWLPNNVGPLLCELKVGRGRGRN